MNIIGLKMHKTVKGDNHMNFIKKLFKKKRKAVDTYEPFEPYAYMGSLGVSPEHMKQFAAATAILKDFLKNKEYR